MRVRLSISLLLLLLLAGTARAEVVLILRREAKPSGNYVRICDIARVEGPDEQVREVSLTVLGPAPMGGETKEFSRWDVETRLYEMGVAAKVSFSGNDVVRVYGSGASRRLPRNDAAFLELGPDPVPGRRTGNGGVDSGESAALVLNPKDEAGRTTKPPPREFPVRERSVPPLEAMSGDAKRRLAQAVSNFLADRYKESGRRSDVEVEAKILDVSSAISYEAHDIQVEEGLDGRVPGKAVLRVTVRDSADASPREVKVEADTEVYAQALVAARQLSKGEALEPHDVAVTRVRMEAGKAYFPPNPKVVTGREMIRALKAGEPILASEAAPGQAVKRGQKVLVETIGTGWEVKAVGKALGSGMIGDHITVEDTTTKAKYTAKITGRNKVAVLVTKNLK